MQRHAANEGNTETKRNWSLIEVGGHPVSWGMYVEPNG